MRVIITLDRYNGESSQLKIGDLESVDLRSLIYAMMESDVCGVTITKDKNLFKVMDKLNGDSKA
jgi:hypothetical protein